MLKSVDTLSNFIRSVVSLIVVGVVGFGGWVGYNTYYEKDLAIRAKDSELQKTKADLDELKGDVAVKAKQIVVLNKDLEVKKREIVRLATANKFLKVDHRLATIDVIKQEEAEQGNPDSLMTTLSFVEVDDEGRPLEEPREFTIRGDIVHVDGLEVSFKDEYVEQGDEIRGTAIYLFRRIYGDDQKPSEGFVLEPIGSRPAAYSRGDEPSEFERDIWKNFWDYATDPDKAAAAGVRAAQGKAVYNQLKKGMRYKVTLRSSGDVSIVPERVADGDASL